MKSTTSRKLSNIDERDLFRSQFDKTRPCRFFQQGRCRRGADCTFAHGTVETPPDLTKTSLCKLWAEGQCKLAAEECPFAHGKDELRRSPLYQAQGSRRDHQATRNEGYGEQKAASYQTKADRPASPKSDMKGPALEPQAKSVAEIYKIFKEQHDQRHPQPVKSPLVPEPAFFESPLIPNAFDAFRGTWGSGGGLSMPLPCDETVRSLIPPLHDIPAYDAPLSLWSHDYPEALEPAKVRQVTPTCGRGSGSPADISTVASLDDISDAYFDFLNC